MANKRNGIDVDKWDYFARYGDDLLNPLVGVMERINNMIIVNPKTKLL